MKQQITTADIPLIVIAGPTASGKTALAVELCRRINGEVVSADSMQVYETLRIGTARPMLEEQNGVPHHLQGFLPLGASYSVAKYAADAHRVIADIHTRGKMPVLCGGTGLYIQAVTENLQYEEQSGDRTVREQLHRRLETEGAEVLLLELAKIDEATAARLHKNDHGRIVRALELYLTTGRTLSEQNAASRKEASPYRLCGFRLEYNDREVLYDRINRRAEWMMENGLEQETAFLFRQPQTDTVRQAIGYKEIAPYLAGDITREQALAALQQGTRRYAKRQMSWFRHQAWLEPLYMDDDSTPLVEAIKRITAFLEKE
jgi:tRNA dimethylallyltransferase